MNIRVMLVAFLALASGISAMALVHVLKSPQAGPVIEKVGVVYAASDIKPGEGITASMLEIRQVPKADAPADAVSEIADVVDRAAFYQIDQGDVVRRKKLAEKGAGRGMAALIRPGMRAFTIQTPSFSSTLAGFLLPGNRVDVLLTMNTGVAVDDETGGTSTSTLLQNAEILAVHTTVNTPTNNKIDPNEARSVTLLVSPEDASLLDLGQNKGTLHLSLRNIKDIGSNKPKPTTMADLQLPKPRAPKVQPPAVTHLAIRTLRGAAMGTDSITIVTPNPDRTPAPFTLDPPPTLTQADPVARPRP